LLSKSTPPRVARAVRASLLALALAARVESAEAQNPGTYQVGNVPVAGFVATLEFPVHRSLAAEFDLATVSQGTYTDRDPIQYLSLVMPGAWLHYDGTKNLRLSLAFQELLNYAVPSIGVKESHEERGVVRARIQQPRGEAALYEIVQLDVRSFDDPGGTHRVVFRPRFRVGQGFNLDATRIHSLVLYEEVAFRFAAQGYAARPFDFFRAFIGYSWTSRRGTFVSLGMIGQLSLNPPATRYDVLWGPVLSLSYRIRAAPPETPPEPPEPEVN
jgi:hypothetical protein